MPTPTAPATALLAPGTPQWWADLKLGIFVHYSLFSVPAWGSEWYVYYLSMPGSSTYNYHKATYGTNFNYDDFLGLWKATAFDANEWLRIFESAGAKYFVITTKHHDGVPLFNSKVSGRNTFALGPKRDFIAEIVAAQKATNSQLKRGLYYSIGEWYNLLYPRLPHNPYTNAVIPYVGCPTTGSYVDDFLHPQMKELIDNYTPDILWGDGQFLGPGPDIQAARTYPWNLSQTYYHDDAIIQYFVSQAAAQGRQVAYNDRLFLSSNGYSTFEGGVPPTLQQTPVETCMRTGSSWAFNIQDNDGSYMSVQTMVNLLVDIVSKNSNFLLNIGPRSDGSIATVIQQRLAGLGAWMAINGRAIYATRPWTRFGDNNLRYTRTQSTFNVISLGWPGSQVTVDGTIPVNSNWRAYLLGTTDVPLTWTHSGSNIVITMPPAGPSSTASLYAYTIQFR